MKGRKEESEKVRKDIDMKEQREKGNLEYRIDYAWKWNEQAVNKKPHFLDMENQ